MIDVTWHEHFFPAGSDLTEEDDDLPRFDAVKLVDGTYAVYCPVKDAIVKTCSSRIEACGWAQYLADNPEGT